MSHRPSSSKGQRSHQAGYRKPDDLETECKAAYLCVLDDLDDKIRNRDQLMKVLQQSGRNPTNRSLQKYWPEHRNSMTFEEFVEVCRKEKITTEDDLMKAFKKIDKDGNGLISNEELKDVLCKRGERLSAKEVQQIIDEVDEDGNGELDFKEFCNYLLKTQMEAKQMSKTRMEKKMKRKGRTVKPEPTSTALSKKTSNKDENGSSDDSDIVVGSHHADVNNHLDRTQPSLTKKSGKVSKPRDLSSWQALSGHGCLFLENDGQIVSHHYELELPVASNVWFTCQPASVHKGDVVSRLDSQRTPLDTMLAVLRSNKGVVAITEERDSNGMFCLRCDLDKGRYRLVPFNTGTRFKKPSRVDVEEKKLVKKKGDAVSITQEFRAALGHIFDMCDLDKDGFLSRQEFNFFNMRTSDEEVEDDEWTVVQESIELDRHRVPLSGFIKLNEMEAEDNDGDTDDLWVTLNSMGFDKSLTVSSAAVYHVEVYVEERCNASLKPCALEGGGKLLEGAVVDTVIAKGESRAVKQMKDLTIHTYTTDAWASVVVENKSNNRVQLNLDCSKSTNCLTNRKSLDFTISLPPKSVAIGHHLMPKDESKPWPVTVTESIL